MTALPLNIPREDDTEDDTESVASGATTARTGMQPKVITDAVQALHKRDSAKKFATGPKASVQELTEFFKEIDISDAKKLFLANWLTDKDLLEQWQRYEYRAGKIGSPKQTVCPRAKLAFALMFEVLTSWLWIQKHQKKTQEMSSIIENTLLVYGGAYAMGARQLDLDSLRDAIKAPDGHGPNFMVLNVDPDNGLDAFAAESRGHNVWSVSTLLDENKMRNLRNSLKSQDGDGSQDKNVIFFSDIRDGKLGLAVQKMEATEFLFVYLLSKLAQARQDANSATSQKFLTTMIKTCFQTLRNLDRHIQSLIAKDDNDQHKMADAVDFASLKTRFEYPFSRRDKREVAVDTVVIREHGHHTSTEVSKLLLPSHKPATTEPSKHSLVNIDNLEAYLNSVFDKEDLCESVLLQLVNKVRAELDLGPLPDLTKLPAFDKVKDVKEQSMAVKEFENVAFARGPNFGARGDMESCTRNLTMKVLQRACNFINPTDYLTEGLPDDLLQFIDTDVDTRNFTASVHQYGGTISLIKMKRYITQRQLEFFEREHSIPRAAADDSLFQLRDASNVNERNLLKSTAQEMLECLMHEAKAHYATIRSPMLYRLDNYTETPLVTNEITAFTVLVMQMLCAVLVEYSSDKGIKETLTGALMQAFKTLYVPKSFQGLTFWTQYVTGTQSTDAHLVPWLMRSVPLKVACFVNYSADFKNEKTPDGKKVNAKRDFGNSYEAHQLLVDVLVGFSRAVGESAEYKQFASSPPQPWLPMALSAYHVHNTKIRAKVCHNKDIAKKLYFVCGGLPHNLTFDDFMHNFGDYFYKTKDGVLAFKAHEAHNKVLSEEKRQVRTVWNWPANKPTIFYLLHSPQVFSGLLEAVQNNSDIHKWILYVRDKNNFSLLQTAVFYKQAAAVDLMSKILAKDETLNESNNALRAAVSDREKGTPGSRARPHIFLRNDGGKDRVKKVKQSLETITAVNKINSTVKMSGLRSAYVSD